MAGVWRCMLAVMVLMCVCLWGSSEAVGGAKSRPRPQRRRPKKPKVNPIDVTPPAQNIDMQQMTGTWHLLNTASKCSYLINHGTKVEPTVMTLTRSSASDQTLSVSSKTRHINQCWEILQVYNLTPTPGRLMLKGRSVDNLSEPMLTKFEQLAAKQDLGLAYLFPFPTYSHCGDVDQDHVITGVLLCAGG
ncbi:complement component C8 gamma chain isoform X3 [Xiphias gladius]|uniref:complement component C8 gamma chain isoform X3 n=1 Tax=Xiphias gladius TaxID=8245 RepID=UPI001A99F196|nr:complement component C8 gamma chain isoform X3 [Xiphias gladius]